MMCEHKKSWMLQFCAEANTYNIAPENGLLFGLVLSPNWTVTQLFFQCKLELLV